ILRIRKEFTRVVLQAGYTGNKGVIFDGNIKQIISGRESGTDTFIDIVAGDGDRAYNFAIVNTTLTAGATQLDQVNACSVPMAAKGVLKGYVGNMSTERLPRGKVLYGNARDFLRTIASTTDTQFSIQNGKTTFVGVKTYLPGEAVVINSVTGMIGTPQQTND